MNNHYPFSDSSEFYPEKISLFFKILSVSTPYISRILGIPSKTKKNLKLAYLLHKIIFENTL